MNGKTMRSPESLQLSDFDITDAAYSNGTLLDEIKQGSMEELGSFKQGSKDWEYNLSCGCQHVMSIGNLKGPRS